MRIRILALDMDLRIRISALARSLFFSFMSYLFILFLIIALDVFSRRDFDFARAAAISAFYIGFLVVLFGVVLLVFRIKLKPRRRI